MFDLKIGTLESFLERLEAALSNCAAPIDLDVDFDRVLEILDSDLLEQGQLLAKIHVLREAGKPLPWPAADVDQLVALLENQCHTIEWLELVLSNPDPLTCSYAQQCILEQLTNPTVPPLRLSIQHVQGQLETLTRIQPDGLTKLLEYMQELNRAREWLIALDPTRLALYNTDWDEISATLQQVDEQLLIYQGYLDTELMSDKDLAQSFQQQELRPEITADYSFRKNYEQTQRFPTERLSVGNPRVPKVTRQAKHDRCKPHESKQEIDLIQPIDQTVGRLDGQPKHDLCKPQYQAKREVDLFQPIDQTVGRLDVGFLYRGRGSCSHNCSCNLCQDLDRLQAATDQLTAKRETPSTSWLGVEIDLLVSLAVRLKDHVHVAQQTQAEATADLDLLGTATRGRLIDRLADLRRALVTRAKASSSKQLALQVTNCPSTYLWYGREAMLLFGWLQDPTYQTLCKLDQAQLDCRPPLLIKALAKIRTKLSIAQWQARFQQCTDKLETAFLIYLDYRDRGAVHEFQDWLCDQIKQLIQPYRQMGYDSASVEIAFGPLYYLLIALRKPFDEFWPFQGCAKFALGWIY